VPSSAEYGRAGLPQTQGYANSAQVSGVYGYSNHQHPNGYTNPQPNGYATLQLDTSDTNNYDYVPPHQ